MALIPIDGINNEALVVDTSDARSLLTDEGGNNPDFDGDGVVFQLEEITISNEGSADAWVEVWDADEGSSPAAAVQKLTIRVPAETTVERRFGGTGPRFVTGIVGSLSGGTGTVNAGGVQTSGFLI